MTKDEDNTTNNITSFKAFKAGERNNNITQDRSKEFPSAVPNPKLRKYVIELKDDETVEIEGFVGLGNSFLAVGDANGLIKFGAAAGEWLYVTDVTDDSNTTT